MELLRSLLFVPADSPRKIAKARSLRPDAFLYDLEDAVAPDKKQQARAWLEAELGSLAGSPSKIIVRVNRVRSEFFDADLRAAVHPAVDGLLLPKCDDPADLARVHAKVGMLESQKGIRNGKTEFLLILETALGELQAEFFEAGSRRQPVDENGVDVRAVATGNGAERPGFDGARAGFVATRDAAGGCEQQSETEPSGQCLPSHPESSGFTDFAGFSVPRSIGKSLRTAPTVAAYRVESPRICAGGSGRAISGVWVAAGTAADPAFLTPLWPSRG